MNLVSRLLDKLPGRPITIRYGGALDAGVNMTGDGGERLRYLDVFNVDDRPRDAKGSPLFYTDTQGERHEIA